MPTTVMWGERGLVTTFFQDLSANKTMDRWQQFLSTIDFGNQRPDFDWDQVADIWAVVEPTFGTKGFGLPDLVAVMTFRDESRVVIFLEAKLGTYIESALPPIGARHVRGFNSKINGQLELKHRLALALAAFQDGQILMDVPWVVNTPYQQTGAPRYVADQEVLHHVAERLARLHPSRYLHVALTSDTQNPFTTEALRPMWPEIFLPDGTVNEWNNQSNRFGWVSWKSCRDLASGWSGHSAFLPTYDLNKHYIIVPQPLAVVPNQVQWPQGRPGVGVSLVRIPHFVQNTAIHFSWKGKSCKLRSYLTRVDGMDPLDPELRNTLDVIALIDAQCEKRFGRGRPPFDGIPEWTALIQAQNEIWGLGG